MTMRAAPHRHRVAQLVALVAIVGLGLASRTVPSTWPPLVAKYPGDALWALMVFIGLGAILPRASTARLATAALVFSFAIEALKLVHAPWLVAIRGTTIGHLVFGHAFSWQNLVAYVIGVAVGAVVDRAVVLTREGAREHASLDRPSEVRMQRVTGIGGIFFNARDPVALRAWYQRHLGMDVQDWGGTAFAWTDASGQATKGTTIWSIGPVDGEAFAPSRSSFMINYRVDDLTALLAALRDEGCEVLEKTDDSAYGKFGWVMDPEGNKVELWQPPEGQ